MVPGEGVATQHRVGFKGMVPGEVVATQHRVGYCRGTAVHGGAENTEILNINTNLRGH